MDGDCIDGFSNDDVSRDNDGVLVVMMVAKEIAVVIHF